MFRVFGRSVIGVCTSLTLVRTWSGKCQSTSYLSSSSVRVGSSLLKKLLALCPAAISLSGSLSRMLNVLWNCAGVLVSWHTKGGHMSDLGFGGRTGGGGSSSF